VRFLRRRVARQLDRQEASATALSDASELFDPAALTIGFARRFATYKRATLVLRDLDRLHRILSDPERPVQLVFAGKAHPADEGGQALVRQIHTLSSDPRFHGRILFLEDYDMAVGRALTRGVDVWLNNPRRPLEASGTSGQKAAMNGVLNLSILDGWWPEGYDGMNGWAIGGDRAYDDEARGDEADADVLYDLLEREVVPLYYDRDASGVPEGWMRRSARAIATVTPRFNAQRMVKDYVRQYYAPPAAAAAPSRPTTAPWRPTWRVGASGWPSTGRRCTSRGARWRRARGASATSSRSRRSSTRAACGVTDIVVELVYGLERDGLQHGLHRVPMERRETFPDGGERYVARFAPAISGRLVYGVRAYPTHPGLAHPFDALAMRWG
jgi:glycogen phosphorylase